MYINGRKITLHELRNIADKLIGSLIDDLYKTITTEGIQAVEKKKSNQIDLLKQLLQHFINAEEYEKCAYIRDLLNKYKLTKTTKNGIHKKK